MADRTAGLLRHAQVTERLGRTRHAGVQSGPSLRTRRVVSGATARRFAWSALLLLPLLAGCGPTRPPPATTAFGGLPVSGTLADAKRAGFVNCVQPDWGSLRCRRHGVMLEGAGPYEAAVDLAGNDGSGGFDQVILWHDRDQYAVYKITDVLERRGWRNCSTGSGDRGDQIVYTHGGVKVRISMDLSYWGKRRLRLLPDWNTERRC